MAKITFTYDMRHHTGGVTDVLVTSTDYRSAMKELNEKFPELSAEVIAQHSVSIDGVIAHTPLLETFTEDSEVIFINKITAG